MSCLPGKGIDVAFVRKMCAASPFMQAEARCAICPDDGCIGIIIICLISEQVHTGFPLLICFANPMLFESIEAIDCPLVVTNLILSLRVLMKIGSIGIMLIMLTHSASNFFPFPAGSMQGIRIVGRAFGFNPHVLFMWWHMAPRTVARQDLL